MASAAEISAAVSLVYEAAIDFERWPPALVRLSDLLGGTMAALVKGDRADGSVSTLAVRSYAGAREEYAAYYHALNVPWQRMAYLRPGATVVDRALFPREATRRSPLYGEFLQRLDTHSFLTAMLVQDGAFSAVATFGRAARAGEWDAPHVALLDLLAPHLKLAAEISRRLAGIDRASTGPALDALAEGAIVLDAAGRLAFANAAAEALLTTGDGLLVRDGKLQAWSPSDKPMLQAAVVAALQTGEFGRQGQSLALQRPFPRQPLRVTVAPLHGEAAWFLAHPPAAVVFVHDPEAIAPPLPDQLRALFGLTPTEAQVAAQVFRGQGLTAAAEVLGMSPNTAKVHLRRVFDKTGTHRQAELVRIIARALPDAGS